MSLGTAVRVVVFKASPSCSGSWGKQVAEMENKMRHKLADHTSEDKFMSSSAYKLKKYAISIKCTSIKAIKVFA